jgi:hypothetical protein
MKISHLNVAKVYEKKSFILGGFKNCITCERAYKDYGEPLIFMGQSKKRSIMVLDYIRFTF